MEIFSTAVSAEFHHFPQFLSHSSDLSSGSAVTSATWTFPSWGSLQWWWPTLRGTFTWSCRTGRWQMTRWENSTFPSCRTMVSSSCGSQAGKETSTFFFFLLFLSCSPFFFHLLFLVFSLFLLWRSCCLYYLMTLVHLWVFFCLFFLAFFLPCSISALTLQKVQKQFHFVFEKFYKFFTLICSWRIKAPGHY